MNFIDIYKENRSSSYKKSIEAARKALNSLSLNKLQARQSPNPDRNLKTLSDYSKETLFEISKDYINHQPEITSNSRGILIN